MRTLSHRLLELEVLNLICSSIAPWNWGQWGLISDLAGQVDNRFPDGLVCKCQENCLHWTGTYSASLFLGIFLNIQLWAWTTMILLYITNIPSLFILLSTKTLYKIPDSMVNFVVIIRIKVKNSVIYLCYLIL